MKAKRFIDVTEEVVTALARGAATCALGRASPQHGVPFALMVGGMHAQVMTDDESQFATREGKAVVTLGLTRDQVLALRESCDACLAEPAA